MSPGIGMTLLEQGSIEGMIVVKPHISSNDISLCDMYLFLMQFNLEDDGIQFLTCVVN